MLRIGLLLLILALAVTPPAHAQPSDAEAAVRATIDGLFDAMRAGDSTGVRAAFAEGATLQTAATARDSATGETRTVVRSTSIARFADAVGQPKEKVWDERIWDVEIRVDDILATAWVPYAFYLGDDLQHCGVNAVQLVHRADRWRILHLVDTRTPAPDCDVPASAQK